MFAEYEDGSLSSWVNKERFQGYLHIDGFTLYELGETGSAFHLQPYFIFIFFDLKNVILQQSTLFSNIHM